MKPIRGYFLPVIFLTLLYSCKKEYSYEGGPLSSGFLIKDNNNNCSLVTVAGNYKTGISLTDSNFLDVQVHVTRTGRYSITSDIVNGYSFGASGNFIDTGIALIKLPANGKPVTAGANLVKIRYDSSECEVMVQVLDTANGVVHTTNPDHFPLTDNSHWTYDDLTFSGDSIIWTLTGNNITLGGTSHHILDEYKSFYPATNKHYYTKTGDDYFKYVSLSGYTSAFNYSPTIYADLNFLKENIGTGYSWYSETYTGRTSLIWQFIDLRYHFRCINADATVIINGKTFIHVYKIEMIPEAAETGFTLIPTGEIHTYYYAKGIGLIYSEFYNGILPHPVLQIRNWLVN